MAENNKSCWTSMLYSFLTGAVIGAGVALLFAPVSGKEARKYIGDEYDELKSKLKRLEEKLHRSPRNISDSDEEDL
ncbi:MAG: YtxH domain-containing protein [Candidatus Aminicenantes bacterium]|nr:YtxH domain-containing protein [Candidatus Aminicenantes bacterium]